MGKVRSFKDGMRVLVKAIGEHEATTIPPTPGRVVRLRRDGGAWVRLDERPAGVSFPFPDDDSRANNVCTFPEDCETAPATPSRNEVAK
jgi:hypothetical protein